MGCQSRGVLSGNFVLSNTTTDFNCRCFLLPLSFSQSKICLPCFGSRRRCQIVLPDTHIVPQSPIYPSPRAPNILPSLCQLYYRYPVLCILHRPPGSAFSLFPVQRGPFKNSNTGPTRYCYCKQQTESFRYIDGSCPPRIPPGIHPVPQSGWLRVCVFFYFLSRYMRPDRAMAAAEPLPKQRWWAFLHIPYSWPRTGLTGHSGTPAGGCVGMRRVGVANHKVNSAGES